MELLILTLGTPSFFSTSLRRRFISEMQVASLPPSLISSSFPFNHNLSFVNDGSAREVVVDRKWSWSNVTESEEFVGKISFVSRLPQYLKKLRTIISLTAYVDRWSITHT